MHFCFALPKLGSFLQPRQCEIASTRHGDGDGDGDGDDDDDDDAAKADRHQPCLTVETVSLFGCIKAGFWWGMRQTCGVKLAFWAGVLGS